MASWHRYKYDVVVGKSSISAEGARDDAMSKADAMIAVTPLRRSEIVGIAADAMCCSGIEGTGGGEAEWNCYLLIRSW